MSSALAFTYCSLVFEIIIFALFITKRRKRDFKSNIFFMFALCVILGTVTDITNFIIHRTMGLGAQKISWMSHWILVILTFYFYFMYVIYFLKKMNYKKISHVVFKDKTVLGITIFMVLELLVYIFVIPYDKFDIANVDFAPGLSGYVNSITTVVFVSTLMVILFKERKKLQREEIENVIFQTVLEGIALAMQFYFKQFSFVPLAEALTLIFIYCNYENPDLVIIDEKETEKGKVEKINKTKSYLLNSVKRKIGKQTETIRKLNRELNKENLSTEEKLEIIKSIKVPAAEIINLLDTRINVSNLVDNNIIKTEKYRVRTFVDAIVSHVESKKINQRVKFEYDINPNIPFVLSGDVEKLIVIVNSLLDNAMAHTDYGKIILTVSFNPISNTHIELMINVIDTGSGMTKEELEELNNNKSLNGIAFLRTITESLNGSFIYESTLGAGTIFYLKIPQTIEDNTPMGGYTKFIDFKKKKINYRDYNHKRVLIVDDNDISVKVLSKFLLKYNFDIEVASNGLGCIAQVKAGVNYDLIFMDDYMSGSTGKDTLELIQKIAKISKYHLPPVIVFTANAITGAKEDYLKRGFAEYIEKPIDPHELDKILSKLLDEEE